ncbi:16S rRNA (uracil(1498)-N(3))-methyltransferase [Curtobacterium flaccumfaciens]|uniref:16S rRNA (uracil(1498)-N(3))-methyltransferase n=1 Tax=Curtobacterium TaxID=2034 RepID=UPI000DA89BCB|nr:MULTISPECIES: 16S rRNA (uracil(1498)-N(3))-methyltransferase [Curtobacterium]MCS6558609.1 16S rRNA (uracil(1498)-N(3))-methyltransferase [Curtobacterium flaccumfaciens]PZE63827.1 16S rRNA (uracil(1498)-N(3))-methyltransferase [Curtobacterium sp. MCLR17_059]PZF20336.1 16S rRNA (uracil(1498)-N(3))-methyltransferase [Curtobacterium sp. MCLR17_045]PZF46273.1 16S rRNA (uracil(1498)-N(3))-methyltransferase [Curtobacterium sp. MCLR17_057]
MASLYLVDSLDGVAVGDPVSLDGAEGRHAVSVARVRVGEVLRIADGRGTVVSGPVTTLGKDTLELAVETVEHQDAPRPSLTLVQALAKGGRDEMAVQAATEIGVDRVVPWSAARSVSRWDGAKVEKGRARWASIAHEAAKQAIRPRVPVVAPLVTTGQLVSALGEGTALVLLDPTATVRLATWEPPTDAEDIALVVGPEGGIDGAELDRLEAAGAVRVRLGDSVLRTSTAGPAALAVLQARLGRW